MELKKTEGAGSFDLATKNLLKLLEFGGDGFGDFWLKNDKPAEAKEFISRNEEGLKTLLKNSTGLIVIKNARMSFFLKTYKATTREKIIELLNIAVAIAKRKSRNE